MNELKTTNNTNKSRITGQILVIIGGIITSLYEFSYVTIWFLYSGAQPILYLVFFAIILHIAGIVFTIRKDNVYLLLVTALILSYIIISNAGIGIFQDTEGLLIFGSLLLIYIGMILIKYPNIKKKISRIKNKK